MKPDPDKFTVLALVVCLKLMKLREEVRAKEKRDL